MRRVNYLSQTEFQQINAFIFDTHPFSPKEFFFFPRPAGKPSQSSVGTNHAVTRNVRSIRILVERVPDCPDGSWIIYFAGDPLVRGDFPAGDFFRRSVDFFVEG